MPDHTLITPPVGPFSSKEKLAAWVKELEQMPDDPQVRASLQQARKWLEQASA